MLPPCHVCMPPKVGVQLEVNERYFDYRWIQAGLPRQILGKCGQLYKPRFHMADDSSMIDAHVEGITDAIRAGHGGEGNCRFEMVDIR